MNCERIHSNGSYQYSTDDFNNSITIGNAYADIEVNAGETTTFWVKAKNSADLMSNAATVVITAPDAG